MNSAEQSAARIGIITVSDRASCGEYEDKSGPAVHGWRTRALATPWKAVARVIPDDRRLIEATLSELADIAITDGPPMLKSENARLSDWIYVDIRGRDLKSAVDQMQREVSEQVKLPEGISLTWSGQYEYLERATGERPEVFAIHHRMGNGSEGSGFSATLRFSERASHR